MDMKNLLAALILVPALAAPAVADKIPLNNLSNYLNKMQTAKGAFTQINDDGSIATGTPNHRSAAALLAAWFAEALDWDEAQRNSAIQFTESQGVPISEVLIDATGRRFEISADADAVRAHSSLPGRDFSQWLPTKATSDAQIVTELLARGGRNELFQKTLHAL